jgi:cell division septation protein DedD
MKNLRKSGWALAALFFFVGASIWEGSAAVSMGGELPERGYYAATNSFPRNTVVDITNLETGKSVRVIVAAGLDTPGLLAVLSRDAAADIGLQSRSIGRIRMTQPTDPIAFSRFTEGFGSSGDPDYDPQASVNANANPLLSESYTPPAGWDNPEDAWAFQEPGSPEAFPIDTPPAYPPENGGSGLTILDEPESLPPPDPAWDQYPYAGGPYDLSLVPSEARPPEEYRDLPPESEIPPLPNRTAPGQDFSRDTPDPAYFVPPIGSAPAAQPDRELTTTPFPPAPPSSSQGASTPPPGPVFSVPFISSLERGRYYLQLGAFSKAEAIEPELTKIGKTYPLAIQNGGTAERPIYRILLGPVNLGESGALLERFKRTGYTDAFVRSGGM